MNSNETTTRIHADLPIFRIDEGEKVVLYVPGYAISTRQRLAQEVKEILAGHERGSSEAREMTKELLQRGRVAKSTWRDLSTKPFAPECLTLYLSNRCNLACTYCYAKPADNAQADIRLQINRQPHVGADAGFPILSQPAIAAAARLVAGHCAAKESPLTLVLHGGGEPTLHWDLLKWAWETCSQIADERGISLWSYVATHGVLAGDRVKWLARHFDLIGLSCDGPPDIQNANRPSAGNMQTSAAVERTAQLLHDDEANYAVRATITPDVVTRQTEIIEFLCDRLFARSVRFEPAYDGRRHAKTFQVEDAATFVEHFLSARDVARRRDCHLELSGVRIDEIHGPFCNPLRDVLQLTPGGEASACFLSVGNNDEADDGMVIGRLDPVTGDFQLNRERVAAQRLRASHIPARCETCHNVYHCARDCPDVCLLTEPQDEDLTDGFRCHVQKLLGRRLILELATQRA